MYIPKNKIKTNQYTRGGEYETLDAGTPYVGPYWLMYNGKIFSGVDPNDLPQEELVLSQPPLYQPPPTIDDSVQEYAYNWNVETVPGQYQNMELITTYNSLKEVDMSSISLLPKAFSPTPTDEDYELGKFVRYFCVKANEPIFIELNKAEYDKLDNQDPNYDWGMYIIFKVIWVITGNEEDVEQTNFNQVQLLEEKLGKTGLGEYLNGNYIQFFARNSAEILYSNGEDGLILPDGTAYIGYYHAMLDGTLMTGKYHGKGEDIVLTSIYD